MSGKVTEGEAAELIVRLGNLGLSVKQAFAIGDILDEKLDARDAEWVAALVEIEKESEALWLDDPSNEVSPSQAWTQSLEWLLIRMTGLGLLSDELKALMTGYDQR